LVKEPVLQDGQVKFDKNGKEMEQITINWNKLTSFRFGKYTANLILVFDNGTRDVPLQSTINFWVIPYKVIIGLIIALLIIFFVTRRLIKSYVNRELKKHLKTNS